MARMPITASAKKELKSSAHRRVFNLRRARAMRDVVKAVRALAQGGKAAEARDLLPKAYQAIDKAAKRGVIKDNTASRKKSRLSSFVKKVSTK